MEVDCELNDGDLNDDDLNDGDLNEEESDMKSVVNINHLPQVVFEYILSHLSPYKDLLDCKLVSKTWELYVKCKFIINNLIK